METGSDKKLIRQIQRAVPVKEHAMEFVADINGVIYVNDSWSITVENVWASLKSIDAKIVLIIGGIDSRNDYVMLADLVKEKVSALICLGTDNSRIMKGLLGTGKEFQAAVSMQEAVELAAGIAKAGELVLLSPACPSYHPFDNYKNRGNTFKWAVASMIQEKK